MCEVWTIPIQKSRSVWIHYLIVFEPGLPAPKYQYSIILCKWLVKCVNKVQHFRKMQSYDDIFKEQSSSWIVFAKRI